MTNTTTAAREPEGAVAAEVAAEVAADETSAGDGPRVIRVALAGCGTVGGQLVELLEARTAAIERSRGVRFQLTRVLVRDGGKCRPAPLRRELLTTDPDAFMETESDVVVEAIGGLDPAGRIAAAALRQGRTFVTANKALIADRGPSLAAIAREHGGRLYYEAAVAGGVPVIRTLRDALPETGIQSIRGILNGTTNYLLTRMAEGAAFAEALTESRTLGFAEADSSRDLDGRDAADKVRILAWLAFGTEPPTLPVHRRGLLPHPDRIAADAADFGGVARLMGECVLEGEGVLATVEPVIVSRRSAAANTVGADNMVEVETVHNGTIRLSGPGAGGAPTASALLSDMVHHVVREPRVPASRLPASDERAHVWVISARSGAGGGDGDRLVDLLREAGIEVPSVRSDAAAGVVRVRTESCVRARILDVEEALEREGLEPVLTRYEDA